MKWWHRYEKFRLYVCWLNHLSNRQAALSAVATVHLPEGMDSIRAELVVWDFVNVTAWQLRYLRSRSRARRLRRLILCHASCSSLLSAIWSHSCTSLLSTSNEQAEWWNHLNCGSTIEIVILMHISIEIVNRNNKLRLTATIIQSAQRKTATVAAARRTGLVRGQLLPVSAGLLFGLLVAVLGVNGSL